MRSLNFRDNVLWAIAEKDGLDPTEDLMPDLAREYVSSINSWLRRLYDVTDWPEWAEIQQFTPNPTSHVVSWDALPTTSSNEGPVADDPLKIGKPLKVYLTDPRLTSMPGDTPFRLTSAGIYVGLNHGGSVWIKYVPRAPVFTSEVWNAARTYQRSEVTYSPTTGECYRSKVNNNRGHDPAGEVVNEQPLGTEITQERVPDDPGLSSLDKIMDVDYSALTPDPAGTINFFSIYSDTPPHTLVDAVVYNGLAGETATQIRDGVLAALIADAALSSYTFTALSSPLRIRVQKLEDFSVYPAPFSKSTGTGLETFLKQTQVQAYIAALASTNSGARQMTTVSISADQVKSGGTYALLFRDEIGAEHSVSYVALAHDTAKQIISGLINAIQTAKATDTFFNDVFASLDTTNSQLNVSVGQSAGLDATMSPPGSAYWAVMPFPFALVDQVVRGVYADSLKTSGQADKGAMEEQSVPTETQLRMNAALASGVEVLTDQEMGRGRYAK